MPTYSNYAKTGGSVMFGFFFGSDFKNDVGVDVSDLPGKVADSAVNLPLDVQYNIGSSGGAQSSVAALFNKLLNRGSGGVAGSQVRLPVVANKTESVYGFDYTGDVSAKLYPVTYYPGYASGDNIVQGEWESTEWYPGVFDEPENASFSRKLKQGDNPGSDLYFYVLAEADCFIQSVYDAGSAGSGVINLGDNSVSGWALQVLDPVSSVSYFNAGGGEPLSDLAGGSSVRPCNFLLAYKNERGQASYTSGGMTNYNYTLSGYALLLYKISGAAQAAAPASIVHDAYTVKSGGFTPYSGKNNYGNWDSDFIQFKVGAAGKYMTYMSPEMTWYDGGSSRNINVSAELHFTNNETYKTIGYESVAVSGGDSDVGGFYGVETQVSAAESDSPGFWGKFRITSPKISYGYNLECRLLDITPEGENYFLGGFRGLDVPYDEAGKYNTSGDAAPYICHLYFLNRRVSPKEWLESDTGRQFLSGCQLAISGVMDNVSVTPLGSSTPVAGWLDTPVIQTGDVREDNILSSYFRFPVTFGPTSLRYVEQGENDTPAGSWLSSLCGSMEYIKFEDSGKAIQPVAVRNNTESGVTTLNTRIYSNVVGADATKNFRDNFFNDSSAYSQYSCANDSSLKMKGYTYKQEFKISPNRGLEGESDRLAQIFVFYYHFLYLDFAHYAYMNCHRGEEFDLEDYTEKMSADYLQSHLPVFKCGSIHIPDENEQALLSQRHFSENDSAGDPLEGRLFSEQSFYSLPVESADPMYYGALKFSNRSAQDSSLNTEVSAQAYKSKGTSASGLSTDLLNENTLLYELHGTGVPDAGSAVYLINAAVTGKQADGLPLFSIIK